MTTREVVLHGGSPWGFRMYGGIDVQQPIKISRVNSGSKAVLQGIREGDIITSINGQSARNITYSQAHGLLKNSGDTLKLGLNEDNGSPKQRKQNKAVLQETHSETVKQSSSTTYTVTSSKIIKSDENTESKNNDRTSDDRERNGQKRQTVIESPALSPNSTASSDVSTPSTLTEIGADCVTSVHKKQSPRHLIHLQTDGITMADNSNSRSRRRRARNARKKSKQHQNDKQSPSTQKDEESNENNENITLADPLSSTSTPTDISQKSYFVDFPQRSHKDSNDRRSISKSRSLDDDSVKIEELSGTSESEDKVECKAIISEAESDVEWEETNELSCPNQVTLTLSTCSLPLEESIRQQPEISSEEESSLRNFLVGLNLVNSPSDSFKVITDNSESGKVLKACRRAALEQYFLPYVQKPRYLDIISEEGSDLSDKELESRTNYLKQGTPELELRRNESKSFPRKRKLRRGVLGLQKEPVLVSTKLVDTPTVIETVHAFVEENDEAETVYLDEESSSSDSPNSDTEDMETGNTQYEMSSNYKELPEYMGEQNVGCVTSCLPTLDIIESTNDNIATDSVISPDMYSSDSNMNMYSKTDEQISDINGVPKISAFHEINQVDLNELTPPPTPDSSPKNGYSATSKITSNEDVQSLIQEVADCVINVLELTAPTQYSEQNMIYPSESSRSPSHSSSSSRATSLCTVKLNPLSSSIADVQSLLHDANVAATYHQPFSLRHTCLNSLMALSCGTEILQELSDVSRYIQTNITNSNGEMLANNITKAAFLTDNNVSSNNNHNIFNFPVGTQKDPSLEENRIEDSFEESTQEHLSNKPKVIVEESRLLNQLHTKFLQGQARYQNTFNQDNVVEAQKIMERKSNNHTDNISVNVDREDSRSDINYDYGFSNTSVSSTLPRCQKGNDVARLRANSLHEWLHLARSRENISESPENKVNNIDDVTQYSANRLEPSGNTSHKTRRRTSLPQELYQHQMQYILEKEREIQRELEQLEEEKRKLYSEMAPPKVYQGGFMELNNVDSDIKKVRPYSFPQISSEIYRQQMYEEYMKQVAAREDRKLHKVIKLSSSPCVNKVSAQEVIHIPAIEDEFMKKVHEKFGKREESAESENDKRESVNNEPVFVMDGDCLKEANGLPKHLQEFVTITNESFIGDVVYPKLNDGIWTPGQRQEFTPNDIRNHQRQEDKSEPIVPVWTPTSSPTVERKEFRPVNFESPVLSRKNKSTEALSYPIKVQTNPPWQVPVSSSDVGIALKSSLEKRLPTSRSTPASVFNELSSPRLPRAQNPTITLLQKAREGQLPRGAYYIEEGDTHRRANRGYFDPGEILYQKRNEYISESDSETPRKMAELGRRKYEGIGPTLRDGMPVTLRSEVKDSNQSRWYKKMYDTIHKQKPYKAQYPYVSGYLSEPEPGVYDSDYADYKYATLDRRRTPMSEKENTYMTSTMPRTVPLKSSSSSDIVNHRSTSKLNPGRIENYTTGHSSISDQESKQWWNEVMDIFDGHLDQERRLPPKSFMNQALKESGYESDSTLVFRRKDDASQLSPNEQKEAYKVIQKGGDVPLHGLRKPAPERPKEPDPPTPPPKGQHEIRNLRPESPRKYVENQVTIHYKTPVRQEIKEYFSEDELAHRQAEAMKRIYQEDRRRKYLQELQDMNSRRHTDNFIPSQKSPIALNRYDDFDDLATNTAKLRPRSPEPRLVARALYNFVGESPKELTFRKADLIYVRRQIDKNWYEGELNAMVGLLPVSYVEIVPYDCVKTTPRKAHEGQARAKFNFLAKSPLELSLARNELVVITRRVDNNWYEGKIGGRKGIFPVSYVDVLIDPTEPSPPSTKPVAAPASHSLLLNGSAGGKESMGSHNYTPSLSNQQLTNSYHAKPVQMVGNDSYGSLSRSAGNNPVNQALHIETQAEPIPYKAVYKYLPQNDDELELMEGDRVFVLEKCDDGWYVGSSGRTGAFGTFPGNYVEKV